jgi:energy-coupling factor transporter ATP-binding protein EcfA2
MAEVTLTDVTKRFGDITAVDNVNLVIEDGKFTVLVGPSGCGKTTLFRLIVGQEPPDKAAGVGEFLGDREAPARLSGSGPLWVCLLPRFLQCFTQGRGGGNRGSPCGDRGFRP